MTELVLLSGGAAQGLFVRRASAFERAAGVTVAATFGAVGAMAAQLRAGARADLVILSRAVIDALAGEGLVAPASIVDLGAVPTCIAVRERSNAPEVATAEALRAVLLAADEIHFPDPALATAGIHFAAVIDRLGVTARVADACRTHPNGAAAMAALAASKAFAAIGCTQATEILATPRVRPVAPLPPGHELDTVYTAAVCAGAREAALAGRLSRDLAGEDALADRIACGFLGG